MRRLSFILYALLFLLFPVRAFAVEATQTDFDILLIASTRTADGYMDDDVNDGTVVRAAGPSGATHYAAAAPESASATLKQKLLTVNAFIDEIYAAETAGFSAGAYDTLLSAYQSFISTQNFNDTRVHTVLLVKAYALLDQAENEGLIERTGFFRIYYYGNTTTLCTTANEIDPKYDALRKAIQCTAQNSSDIEAKYQALHAALQAFCNDIGLSMGEDQPADTTALSAAVSAAQSDLADAISSGDVAEISTGVYNCSQATDVYNAIAAGQALLAGTPTQADVDSATQAIGTTRQALAQYIVSLRVNEARTALSTAIQDAQAILNTSAAAGEVVFNTSDDSYNITQAQTLYAKMKAGQALLDASSEDITIMQGQTTAIADAKTAFEAWRAAYQPPAPIDKTALLGAISEANQTLQNAVNAGHATQAGGTYAPQQAQDFAAAIVSAQGVYDGASATQEQVDNATSAVGAAATTFAGYVQSNSELQTARTGLLSAITTAKQKLQDAVNAGHATQAGGTYTPQQAQDFATAITAAQNTYDNPSATKGTVGNATTALGTATSTFDNFIQGDSGLEAVRSHLLTAIQKAQQSLDAAIQQGRLSSAEQTEYSRALQQAIEAAQAAHANNASSASALQQALDALQAKHQIFDNEISAASQLDRSALQVAIQNGDIAVAAAAQGWTQYRAGAVSAFQAALSNARQTLAAATTQTEIDQAVAALEAAFQLMQSQQIIVKDEVDDQMLPAPDVYQENGVAMENGVPVYYENGHPANGWVQTHDGGYYYADGASGLRTGWHKVSGKWYYFNTQTYLMSVGWVKDGAWYFLETNGAMKTGWLQEGASWYYLKPSGAMATGWQKAGSKWYYFKSSGVMVTGWQKASGKWYYLKSSGAMATGWQKIGSKWYYFYSSGQMAANTRVGKYTLGKDGAMR